MAFVTSMALVMFLVEMLSAAGWPVLATLVYRLFLPLSVVSLIGAVTLLGGGLTADQRNALDAGAIRAQQNLNAAASLTVSGNQITVTNLTGHKLITGYPEGRRMWLNVKWFDGFGGLVREDGAYGDLSVTHEGSPLTVRTILDRGLGYDFDAGDAFYALGCLLDCLFGSVFPALIGNADDLDDLDGALRDVVAHGVPFLLRREASSEKHAERQGDGGGAECHQRPGALVAGEVSPCVGDPEADQ